MDNPPPYSALPNTDGPHPPPNSSPPPPPEQKRRSDAPHAGPQVVVAQSTAPLLLGPNPTSVTCPSCHAQVETTVETKPNMRTHTLAALLCFIGGLLCFWIPYCVDSCQSKMHYCPNCGAYLGKFSND